MTKGKKIKVYKSVALCSVITHYHSGDHTPYLYMMRDPETDIESGQAGVNSVLGTLVRKLGVNDGEEIEVIVRKTGRRPFGNKRVVLTEPHIYGREG